MLTVKEWIEHYGPRDRAYSPADIETGWNAAMAEFFVHHWEFRVILNSAKGREFKPTRDDRSDWHALPFTCVQPMLELFQGELELRPIFHRAGNIVRGDELLAQMLDGTDVIPF